MVKKKKYLLFVIMALMGNAWAANWQGTVSNAWDTAGNWNPSGVPTTATSVTINGGTANNPVITGTDYAADVSLMPASGVTASLTISSGSLTISTYNLDLAYNAGGTAIITMNGGTVNVLGVGYGNLNMNRPGTERFYLNGGTINVRSLSMSSNALLDISGGTLTIVGNAYNLVRSYIDSGNITAYSGMGEVIVTYNGSNTILTSANYMTSTQPWIDATAYGGFNDTTISSALSAIGSSKKTLLIKAGVWQVANSITSPANVNLKFEQGARLFITSGHTVTINGSIEAPISQIFSGTGNVVLGSLVTEAYPQWFGTISAVDDTNACQKALNSGAKIIRFPAMTYAIEGTVATLVGDNGFFGGLQPPDNTILIFEPGSLLKIIPNLRSQYAAIQLTGKNNVKIYGVTIEGERYAHTPSGGTDEEGHGIFLRGESTDIVIKDATVYDCWGDGICLSGATDGVSVENSIFDNNRRNGCSVTNAKNVSLKKCIFSNSNGTSPQKGIDVETDFATDYMQDIVVEDCYSYHNAGVGFSCASDAYSLNNPIAVVFRDCTSDSDNTGFSVDMAPNDTPGMVYITNCYSRNAGTTGFSTTSANLAVTINGLSIINPNQGNLGAGWERYASGLVVVNNQSNRIAGNITARNVHVESTDGKALKAVCLHNFSSQANSGIKNIDIEATTNMANNKRLYKTDGPYSNYCKVKFTDDPEYATTASLSTTEMAKYISQTITNEGASSNITLSINSGDAALLGNEFTFVVKAAYRITLTMTGIPLVPGSKTSYYSATVGSKLKIRSNGTNWYIVEQVGTWQ